MIIHSSADKGEAKRVEHMVKRCVRLLRKKEYELNLPTNSPDIAAEVLRVKRIQRAGATYGGRRVIQINLNYWQVGRHIFNEYAAFNDHPTIGKIEVASKDEALWIIVAHEVAHHVQYMYCPRVKRFKSTYKKPHGKCFRDVYAYLRRDLINPMIKEGAA